MLEEEIFYLMDEKSYVSTFFVCIKNGCQCEFAVGTLLSTEGDVNIGMHTAEKTPNSGV